MGAGWSCGEALGLWEGHVTLLVAESKGEEGRGQSKYEKWEGRSKGTFIYFVIWWRTTLTAPFPLPSSGSPMRWNIITPFSLENNEGSGWTTSLRFKSCQEALSTEIQARSA